MMTFDQILHNRKSTRSFHSSPYGLWRGKLVEKENMRAEIKKSSEATEFPTRERCHITEIANDSGDEYVSIARAKVEPGVTTAWHRLKE